MEGRKIIKYGVFVFLCIMFLIVSTTFIPGRSFAGDMEILIDDLVNKGVLTKQDAENLLKKMQETKTKEMEKAKAETKAPEPEWLKQIPDWIKNTKISGDIRLRYQYNHTDSSPNDDSERNQGRYRLRVGADTKILNNVTAGFGIASGTGSARAVDQTFQDSFSKKALYINYAYAQYNPLKWLSLMGGKLKANPIFRASSFSQGFWPAELAWDNDITPEGAAVVLNYPALLKLDAINLDVFMNNTFFILDENAPSGSGREPYMFAFQPGFNLKIMKDINLKAAVAKYLFYGVENQPGLDGPPTTGRSNTLVGGSYIYSYDAWIVTAEFGYNIPFGQKFVPYAGLFGEYIYNSDPDDENKGYLGGIRVGYPSLKKFGDWQLSYAYRRLEKDAWLDILPDSTFYGGATNVKGHKGSAYLGLAKNLFCSLNYFHSVNILEFSTPNAKRPEDVVQVDVQFNF
jgi:hypothetical protein